MRLNYESTKDYSHTSFISVCETIPALDSTWHYHDEFELVYIINGEGVRVVGDNLSNFMNEELVLVGPGLPHSWRKEFAIENEHSSVKAVVTRFYSSFAGQDIFKIPELNQLKILLDRSQRGLIFGQDTIAKVHPKLILLPELEGAHRFITLLSVLHILAEGEDTMLLASAKFAMPNSEPEERRLGSTINYISNNFKQQIALEDIAQAAEMTPNSLCRFFKNRTNKTIFQFVNEFRVGKACQMLINNSLSISEICFEVGFNSITSFNRVFKSVKGMTPREFKNYYRL